jgi:hypothetical protein
MRPREGQRVKPSKLPRLFMMFFNAINTISSSSIRAPVGSDQEASSHKQWRFAFDRRAVHVVLPPELAHREHARSARQRRWRVLCVAETAQTPGVSEVLKWGKAIAGPYPREKERRE